ncbi:MAG: DUF3536 domain-containing protein [Deltaproteobacteria bacterium]|nr:DUF3536 domain-containing protein [Deltaproteobacteria bacterium]
MNYLIVHGHFYQPPRENPWVEHLEIQDSAAPYHDWNERITFECYGPNAMARIVDDRNRIIKIINNYEYISFNFGPTLLSWMAKFHPDVYEDIIRADAVSIKRFGGHGNAVAQVYNHIIMPLATQQDKITQVVWGIEDFRYRFGRAPEGMWLAETAVDNATLRVLAGAGIAYTILAPHQARRVRRLGSTVWEDVSDGSVDISRPFLCRLGDGKVINIFFYHGSISRDVAFNRLLESGCHYLGRMMEHFAPIQGKGPALLCLATDGETYGHHHKFGEMALAYAIHLALKNKELTLTNFGQFLAKFPPQYEVEIEENTSWSCAHGLGRWSEDCGCKFNGQYHQKWRRPLREAMDWLKRRLDTIFEQEGRKYFRDPWKVRNEYITCLLTPSNSVQTTFLNRVTGKNLTEADFTAALSLLEMQRYAMYMYTSCGWFFDDIAGLESSQVIAYADRSIDLAEGFGAKGLREEFLAGLAQAPSNDPAYGTGRDVDEKLVAPHRVDPEEVAGQFAIETVLEGLGNGDRLYCFDIKKEEHMRRENAGAVLSLGQVAITDRRTIDKHRLLYAAVYQGGHEITCHTCRVTPERQFKALKDSLIEPFKTLSFSVLENRMEAFFKSPVMSLGRMPVGPRRRAVLKIALQDFEELKETFRQLYIQNKDLMAFLKNLDVPVPEYFVSIAGAVYVDDLAYRLNEFMNAPKGTGRLDWSNIEAANEELKPWGPGRHLFRLGKSLTEVCERCLEDLKPPLDLAMVEDIHRVLDLAGGLNVELNYWRIQNFYRRAMIRLEKSGGAIQPLPPSPEADRSFSGLGHRLGFLLVDEKE